MGGLIQLVAYGEQDIYLTGDPKVTFFQAVYKRHTNFAMETIQQTTNGSSVSNGARMAVVIARNGDLIGQMYLEVELTTTPGSNVISGWSNVYGTFDGTSWMAERAISDIELSIGGQKIDKHYQRWWRLYSELYLDETKKTQYGKLSSLPNLSSKTVYLPLLFFFNRNPGLYLPLIALQYHEVRLDFDISNDFQTYFNPSVFTVWGNYVFLDTEERKMFAQKGHEYLIEQLQYTGASALTATIGNVNLPRITYNHPVKELVWCVTQNSSGGKQMWDFTQNASNNNNIYLTTNPNDCQSAISGPSYNTATLPIGYVTGCPMQNIQTTLGPPPLTNVISSQWCEDGTAVNSSYGPVSQFKLIINGQDRMKAQSGKYYNQMQPYYHHTGNPYPGIYSYSFAIKPEEQQPSGTCNFSRVDNSQASIILKSGVSSDSYLEMFAVNYNVLRIQSGMGGLAFSN